MLPPESAVRGPRPPESALATSLCVAINWERFMTSLISAKAISNKSNKTNKDVHQLNDSTVKSERIWFLRQDPRWSNLLLARGQSILEKGQKKILEPVSVVWDQISEIWPQKGQPGNPALSNHLSGKRGSCRRDIVRVNVTFISRRQAWNNFRCAVLAMGACFLSSHWKHNGGENCFHKSSYD